MKKIILTILLSLLALTGFADENQERIYLVQILNQLNSVQPFIIAAAKEQPKNVRLMVHEPHRFACPPDKQNPELYTHISIDCFYGRSLEAKRNLYQAIVKNLEKLGIPKDHVKIMLREISRENWGIRGGQAACDIELGFKVEV